MSAVFAMQGIGQFVAGLMALIVTAGFRGSLESAKTVGDCDGVCGIAVDRMWRIIIGFGALPGCIALYYRLTIPETPRYTFDVARDIVQGSSDAQAYLSGNVGGTTDEVQRLKAIQADSPNMEIPQASVRVDLKPCTDVLLLTHHDYSGLTYASIMENGATQEPSLALPVHGSYLTWYAFNFGYRLLHKLIKTVQYYRHSMDWV